MEFKLIPSELPGILTNYKCKSYPLNNVSNNLVYKQLSNIMCNPNICIKREGNMAHTILDMFLHSMNLKNTNSTTYSCNSNDDDSDDSNDSVLCHSLLFDNIHNHNTNINIDIIEEDDLCAWTVFKLGKSESILATTHQNAIDKNTFLIRCVCVEYEPQFNTTVTVDKREPDLLLALPLFVYNLNKHFNLGLLEYNKIPTLHKTAVVSDFHITSTSKAAYNYKINKPIFWDTSTSTTSRF